MTTKLSQWFDGAQKPWEPGVYEVEHAPYRLWDGSHWYYGSGTPAAAAIAAVRDPWLVTHSHFKWRGLASKPTKEKK